MALVPATDAIVNTPESVSNPLTQREQEVTELLARRLSNHEIVDRLFISRETAKRHIAEIYRKLEVNKRRQAVDQAASQAILS